MHKERCILEKESHEILYGLLDTHRSPKPAEKIRPSLN